MINNKVVLTYKRKRLSSQAHLAHGVKAANYSPDGPTEISPGSLNPKVEPDSYNEKLSEDNVNISQKDGECSTLVRMHESEESAQQLGRKKKRTRKYERIEKSEMGSMELRSHKVLLSRKLPEDGSRNANPSAIIASVDKAAGSFQIDIPCNNSGSACVITCVEGNSRSKLADLDNLRRSSPICLKSFTERKCSSEYPEASILRTSDSDNVLCNEEHPKENCSTSLITFSRRVKKKQILCKTSVERNSKSEEDQWSSGNWSNHALEASCSHEDSSQKCSIKDQSTSIAVLVEQVDLTTLQVLQQDKMAGADKDAPVGCFPKTKIAGDTSEGLNSGHAEHVHEDPSDKCMAAPTIDSVGNSILAHGSKQSDSAKVCTAVREELENNLVIDVNNSEKMIIPDDVSEERCPRSDLNLPVAPPSPSCPSKVEPNKPFADVVPENVPDSRSSSTPSCAMVLDEEADGRGKELEWLESLDKALQETKKNRSKCQLREQGDSYCRQASNGRASPTIPINSCIQSSCNQDEARGHMNQVSSLHERVFLPRLGEPGTERQQLEETSSRFSLCTDLLGLSLPLNSEGPISSVKDSRNLPPQSSLGFKETDHMHNGQFQWHALGETSSSRRHKQIIEDALIGRRILKGSQGSLLDKYRRYSNDWSEGELDYLWIGVRRHGIYNWNAMLRDPKLHFLESRVAEDLAKRWDLEQRKLLNGTLIQPVNLSRSVISSSVMDDASLSKPAAGTHFGGYGAWSQAFSDYPIPAAETKLSLGDIYLQKENIRKRNMFHSSGLGTTDLLTSAGPSALSFLSNFPNPMAGIRPLKLTRAQNTRFDGESSTLRQRSGERSSHERQPVDPTASSSLPHWLKEVLGAPPVPTGSISAPVSTVGHSANMLGVPFPNLGDQPVSPKDGRGRGILKRKSLASGSNSGGFRVSDLTSTHETAMGARVGPSAVLGLASQRPAASGVTGPDQHIVSDLNKRSSGQIGPSDLVVIDSDASSEETISDNQSSRL